MNRLEVATLVFVVVVAVMSFAQLWAKVPSWLAVVVAFAIFVTGITLAVLLWRQRRYL